MSVRVCGLREDRRARPWPAVPFGRGVLAYRAKEVDFFTTATNDLPRLTPAVD
jgi:hypothetical protein